MKASDFALVKALDSALLRASDSALGQASEIAEQWGALQRPQGDVTARPRKLHRMVVGPEGFEPPTKGL